MKRLHRPPPPALYGETHSQSGVTVPLPKHWYQTLRTPEGGIKERWDSQRQNKQPIREGLKELSDGCCAWCGKKLDPLWTVDHYLPKEKFPRLAYHWPNLLPACSTCNTKFKGSYAPPTLANDSLADPVIGLDPEQTCDFSALLPAHPKRLVHPSEEDPDQHLKFNPTLMRYQAKTEAGTETNQRFFGGGSDGGFAQKMADLSRKIEHELKHPEPHTGIQLLKELIGQHHFIDAFVAYWQSFSNEAGANNRPTDSAAIVSPEARTDTH